MPVLNFRNPKADPRVEGAYGPLGMVIGSFENWSIRRHEGPSQGSGDYDFRAVFSYVNTFTFESELEREYRIKMGGKLYKLDGPFKRTALNGRSLEIDGVRLCLLA
jgi:hypothetical protein